VETAAGAFVLTSSNGTFPPGALFGRLREMLYLHGQCGGKRFSRQNGNLVTMGQNGIYDLCDAQ
jgi:hypothetical protein